MLAVMDQPGFRRFAVGAVLRATTRIAAGEGNLWAGAHPKMLAFLGHAQSPAKRSPSQVLRIGLGDPNAPIVETRYLNLGDPLSGSSVAVFYKGMILVGGVFDDGILLL